MTKPLVHLENVDVSLGGRPILRQINWQLKAGENWAILGGNGSGKSTFLKLVRGELWPAPGGAGKRIYALNGEEQTSAVGVRQAMALVSPELQERYRQQEWRLTGRELIYTGFFATDLLYQKPDARQRKRAQSIARQIGVRHLLDRDVQQLSTGELRKLLMARALTPSPKVLVCDEICDGLDAESRGQLLAALQQISSDGTQLLYTTHRAEELIPTITHTLRLDKGIIVEQQKAPPRPSRGRPQKRERSLSIAQLENGENSRRLIGIRDASVFLGRRKILRHINWELQAGQHWAVLGSNGAGKTTFLKLITSELYPAVGGEVQRFNLTARNTIWDLRRQIGYVSPDLQASYREAATGAEVVASGFFSSVGLMERITARQRRRVEALFAAFGFTALAKKRIPGLSYGEFRKLLLLRALVHEPQVLVLDEPFDGLDAAAREEMLAALERVANDGASLIVVTHHPGDLPACVTHVARLAGGRIVAQGPVRSLAAGSGAR